MRFQEFDSVRTLVEIGEEVQAGEVGTVVMVFDNPREAYEVEFVDEDGCTKAIGTLLPEELELAKEEERGE